MAEHLYTYDDPPSERDLRRASHILADDGVIAYPTDTNWAFACDAGKPKALERLRRMKPSHPKDRPFSIVCASVSMAAEIAVIDNDAYRLLKRALPGAYTIILPASRNLPRQLKDKRRVVGIRVPASNLIRSLVELHAAPLATTSVPELVSDVDPELHLPRFGYEVEQVFGHALDLILDLGQELTGQESTVVDLSGEGVEVVRVGAGDPALFQV
jgi:tRNA threonylcarbamoyl adenosine modification protein (Sua5/YciO/YrdC/YwlC family)